MRPFTRNFAMSVTGAALGLALALTLATSAASAQGSGEKHRSGVFDYYVMALSWSPNWCAKENRHSTEEQCRPGRKESFILHGLWPQYEKGWPDWCRSNMRDPSRRESAQMADIMGSPGLAWHQWKKHGRCSGLTAQAYFEASRKAFDAITLPQILAELPREMRLPASVVEEAFLEANPTLSRDMVTVTCRADEIHEVRICLTKDLEPRRCGADVIRDCRLDNAKMHPPR